MVKNIDKTVTLRRKRLAEWIDIHHDGNQASFVNFTNINQGELSGLLREKSFGERKARKLEGQAGMPEGYLDSVSGGGNIVSIEQTVVEIAKDCIEIIQHNDVSGAMGNGVILNDQPGQITGLQVTMEWADKNIPANTGNKNLRVVTGFGDSMKGMFNSGDPLLVDVGVKLVKYDAVYFFRVGDEGYIKRLQRVPGDGIIVISNNPEYRDWTIKTDMDFEVFGRVLKVWEGKSF